MSFSRMTTATDHVARLPDCPDVAHGYSPKALKEVFDQGATEVKQYLNDVLLKELEATGAGASAAERLGSAYVEGLSGKTVHSQILALKRAVDKVEKDSVDALLGQIPDGSLTEDKLDGALAALLRRKEALALCQVAYTKEGAYHFDAPADGYYRFRLVGGGGAGTLCYGAGEPLGSYDCTGGPSGAYAELTVALTRGQSVSVYVGAGGIPVAHSVGQSLSAMEYDGDYLANGLYSAPGSETAVYFSNEKRVVAHGGDYDTAVKARIYGDWEEPCITRSGRCCVEVADRPLRHGADSFLGQGGGDGIGAGMGAGGQGGRLYLGEDGERRVLELPTRGADGAVLIDYVGGEV